MNVDLDNIHTKRNAVVRAVLDMVEYGSSRRLPYDELSSSFYIDSVDSTKDSIAVFQFMNEMNLITLNQGVYSVTLFGEFIKTKGGWIKYLEDEKLKLEKENRAKDIETEHLLYSTKQVKHFLKTKWIPHIIALIGLIISIIAFIKTL